MEKLSVLDEDWKVLTTLFPSNWKQQATEQGASERLRGFSSAEALMRTLLLHLARGYSLRETVVRAKAAGIADISDVALLKRLRGSERWLQGLCLALLEENQVVAPPLKPGLNLRLFDGTIVKEPGKTGSQWRIHFSVRLPSLECDYFKITPSEGAGTGESFGHYPIAAGDFVIGDAGYAKTRVVEQVARSGAYVMVRVNPRVMVLRGRNNQRFSLLKRLESITRAGQTREWKVLLPATEKPIPGRLCSLRKSEQEIDLAHRRLRRRASKNSTTLLPEIFEFAKYVTVFTTFPEADFATVQILEWYRLRWQIELVFKRLKSLAGLGHLPK